MIFRLQQFPDTRCRVSGPALAPVVAGVCALVLSPLQALGDTGGDKSPLAPHKAVYEITLDKASTGAGIASLTGRMVFEHTGSKCEGYTQSVRFVTRSINTEGEVTVSDMRASTWEAANGKRLRFGSTQFQNEEQVEEIRGEANRTSGSDKLDIEMEEPERRGLTLPAGVQFPVQHSIALLKAARSGAPIMHADLFDGTDKDAKVYATTTIIGKLKPPGNDEIPQKGANMQGLNAMKSWPVSISYFEKSNSNTDGVPIYELAFRLYENGVSRRLFIAYESFAVRGVLSDLTYYKATDCRKNRAPNSNRRANAVRQ